MSHSFKKVKNSSDTIPSSFCLGFTLVEVLVTLGIMGVILSVILFNQRSYTEAATLLRVADELSLSIAQAQVYGLAVRESVSGSADFDSGFGVSLSFLESGGENGYIFFTDLNNSQYFDGGWPCGVPECAQKVEFPMGIRIESFCVVRTAGSDQCNNVSRADISFRRPVPDARIFLYNNGGSSYYPPHLKGVRIVLRSPSGHTRSVTAYTTGQVSVQ